MKISTAVLVLIWAASSYSAHASTAYGTLNNFDVINDTGQQCHGFEIEMDDVHSSNVTYTYDWNHYGKPRIREDNSDPAHPKTFIRHESLKDAAGNYVAYTAVPAMPLSPTNGHQCTNPSVNLGCEHFGIAYSANPSLVKYNWLVDDGVGNLVLGPAVNIATPTWTYFAPVPNLQPAQVQAEIVAPPPPPVVVKEFGDAVWVKSIKTSSHNNNRVELKDLVSDDPDVANEKNWMNGEPSEVEVEWSIQQTEFANPDGANNQLVGAAEALPVGDEVVTRRYEFYKYSGGLQDTGEVWCDLWLDVWTADQIALLKPACLDPADPTQPLPVVGDYIGAQMAGFNVEALLGMIDNVQDGNLSEPYPDRAIVVGGNTPYVTTIAAGALPAGLNIDTATGILSGTPLECGKFAYTVNASDANMVQVSKDYTVNILSQNGCPITAVNGTQIDAEAGLPITPLALFSGGQPAYMTDLSLGDPLPVGLEINSTTSLLSGIPSNAGLANISFGVTDAAAVQAFGTLSINVVPAVTIGPAILPQGAVGLPYTSSALAAVGGMAPYSWSVLSGVLPAGLVLDAASGNISGTPTVPGIFPITFRVTDHLNGTATTAGLSLTIVTPVNITTNALASGTVGRAYSATLSASGGTPPYTWSLLSGNLPPGLSLSASGVISGTPTVVGSYTPGIRVSDSKNGVASKALRLTIINALVISTASLPSGTVSKPYSLTLTAAGGVLPYTWSATGLPAGLTVSGGKIMGIPSTIGAFAVRISVKDGRNVTVSKTLYLIIVRASTGILVDIRGAVSAINTLTKFITVGTTRMYYNTSTVMLLNTTTGKIVTIGTIPVGTRVGMLVQAKGSKDATGKITALSLQFN